MPKRKPKQIETTKELPATTLEGQEAQMINLAFKVAKQRMEDGTASSAEICHFLKLGTEKTKLEEQKLQGEIELAKAKTEALASAKRVEELYDKAIAVMKEYSGLEDNDEIVSGTDYNS